MNFKHILAGAASGLVAAVGVDFHAFATAPGFPPFDWKLASKRWAFGAFSGAVIAAGLSVGQ